MLQLNPCRMRFAGSPSPTERQPGSTELILTPRPVYAKPLDWWSKLEDAFQPNQPAEELPNRRYPDEDNLKTTLTKALERMNLHAKPVMTSIPENRLAEAVPETEDTTLLVDEPMDWRQVGESIERPKVPSLVKRKRDEPVRSHLQPYGESPRKARKTEPRADVAALPEPIQPEDQHSISPFAYFKWPTFPQNQGR